MGLLFTRSGFTSSAPAALHPAWIDSAIASGWTQGTWAKVGGASLSFGLSSTNNLNAVVPSLGGSFGSSAAIMSAWGSGAWAKHYGTFGSLIIRGGGHGDYSGTPVYAWNANTRTWTRLSENYSGAGMPFSGVPDGWWPSHDIQSSGCPASTHGWGMYSYHPPSNSFFVSHGQTSSGGANVSATPGLFDLDTLVWDKRGTSPYNSNMSMEGWHTYDSSRDKFIIHGAGGAAHTVTYNPTSDAWTNNTQDDEAWAQESYTVGAYDPINDFHIVVRPSTGNLHALDASNLADTGAKTALTSASKPSVNEGGGFCYSTNMNKLIWAGGRDNNVYSITKGTGSVRSATWTWANLLDGANAVTLESNESADVYGKAQVVDYGDCTVLYMVKRTGATGTGNMYAFLLEPPP